MCDYSRRDVPSRLAEQGEELVLHKFEMGTLGFAGVADLSEWQEASRVETGGFWSTMRDWLVPRSLPRLSGVCIPPGTQLLLNEVPLHTQISLGLAPSEIVTFTELSSRRYSYRDALLLPNRTRVLLQDLPEGLHALVLSTSPEPAVEPVERELQAA